MLIDADNYTTHLFFFFNLAVLLILCSCAQMALKAQCATFTGLNVKWGIKNTYSVCVCVELLARAASKERCESNRNIRKEGLGSIWLFLADDSLFVIYCVIA